MRIGIAGVTGRMGVLLVEEVHATGCILAGGTGRRVPPPHVPHLPDIAALAAASDCVIDFTSASLVREHARAIAGAGAAWVLGTSGLSDADEALVTESAKRVPVVYAANFAPGVTLLLALAERLGQALPAAQYDAEILEMHHRQKVDAPSGTALALGRAVAAGRGTAFAAVRDSARDGHVGPRKEGAIGFAALRGGQVVGEHTVLFASGSEHVALSSRVFDRRVFATGAVRAAQWARHRAPGLYGMAEVMGL
jgi:4-hydroxy-tetrahydrodipicolinate reductase